MNEMSLAAVSQATAPAGALKDLYEIGEIPPLGHVPKNMYAWAIRKERHGPPDEAMQVVTYRENGCFRYPAKEPSTARVWIGR